MSTTTTTTGINEAAVTTALSLANDPAVSVEVIADAIGKVEALQRFAREAKAGLESVLLEWVLANGPLTLGTVRYYAAPKKTTKCVNVAAALEALMDLSAGDWQRVTDCLSTNAIKHGAARDVLGDAWAKHFEVVEETELKEGKPARVVGLQKIDTAFVR